MNDDAKAVRVLAALSDGDAPHPIRHYLYVPTGEAAVDVAKELQARGFNTEERPGADGVNWLVLVHHEAVPTERLMLSMRRSMEALVARVGGQYDGWEAEVLRDRPTVH
ncbi:MAG: ribonuclease E inhibitor RraB [Parvibaculum sp.]|uniref:ribonuclease E inhibitor RraB n=1 Tax=Parvibaculum sp. TaxID=2024848 RepID=UPI00272925DF|nr:ribonuclease E inhibitor RraB [Parvibaculum sp.]MDO8840436.1 ribonuclease E inhibitor RraB [Parvibaculum sp.]